MWPITLIVRPLYLISSRSRAVKHIHPLSKLCRCVSFFPFFAPFLFKKHSSWLTPPPPSSVYTPAPPSSNWHVTLFIVAEPNSSFYRSWEKTANFTKPPQLRVLSSRRFHPSAAVHQLIQLCGDPCCQNNVGWVTAARGWSLDILCAFRIPRTIFLENLWMVWCKTALIEFHVSISALCRWLCSSIWPICDSGFFYLFLSLFLSLSHTLYFFQPKQSEGDDGPLGSGSVLGLFPQGTFSWPLSHPDSFFFWMCKVLCDAFWDVI